MPLSAVPDRAPISQPRSVLALRLSAMFLTPAVQSSRESAAALPLLTLPTSAESAGSFLHPARVRSRNFSRLRGFAARAWHEALRPPPRSRRVAAFAEALRMPAH